MSSILADNSDYQEYCKLTTAPKGSLPFAKNQDGEFIIEPEERFCRHPVSLNPLVLCGQKLGIRGGLTSHLKRHGGKNGPMLPVAKAAFSGKGGLLKRDHSIVYYQKVMARHRELVNLETPTKQDSNALMTNSLNIPVYGHKTNKAGQPHIPDMNAVIRKLGGVAPCIACRADGSKSNCHFKRTGEVWSFQGRDDFSASQTCMNRVYFKKLDWLGLGTDENFDDVEDEPQMDTPAQLVAAKMKRAAEAVKPAKKTRTKRVSTPPPAAPAPKKARTKAPATSRAKPTKTRKSARKAAEVISSDADDVLDAPSN